MDEGSQCLYHKLVTIHLFLLCSICRESRLIVSVLSTSVDNLDEDDDDDGEDVEDGGLSDLLEQLSSTIGFCLTSFPLFMS